MLRRNDRHYDNRVGSPKAARSGLGRKSAVLLLVALGLVFGVVTVFAALPAPTFPLVPSGAIVPDVWEPDASPSWVNGQPSGWSEGETAAISAYITPANVVVGTTYQAYLCIEIENDSGPGYAFSDFGNWDDTLLPPVLSVTGDTTPAPGDSNWDQIGFVTAYNIDLIAVAGPEQGTNVGSDCDTNYYGVLVTFALTSASNDGVGIDGAWILYGGLLAQPGAPLPPGYTDAVVPAGLGASSINGTFQSRIGGSGDKTINFKGQGGTLPATADLTVTKQCAVTDATDKITFNITVHNAGPSTATNLSLFDQLNTTYYDFTGYQSLVGAVNVGTCAENNIGQNDVTCTLDSLQAGETWTLNLNANLKIPGSDATTPNTATVTATEPEPLDADGIREDTEQCETPVTMASFASEATADGVRFDWSTAVEEGNHGFNIFAVTPDGKVQLNDELITSNAISSSDPQDYSFVAEGVEAEQFLVQSVDVRGHVEQMGPFALGEAVGERVTPDVIDWESVRAESEAKAVQRNRVNAMRQLLREAGRGRAPSAASAAAASGAVNVVVNEDGLYRVSYEALRDAGLDLSGVAASEIAVTSQGASVPVHVSDTRNFGAGDYLEFYGEGLQSMVSADNVYTVQVNAALAEQVVENAERAPRKSVDAAFYMETLTYDENKSIFSYLSSTEPWVNGYLVSSAAYQGQDFAFSGVDNYVAGAAAVEVSAQIWGGLEEPHHAYTELNGTLLSNHKFNGITKDSIEKTLPEGVLQNGQNVFRMSTGRGGKDILAFDWVSVTYPRAFVAREGMLQFDAAAESFTVAGLGSSDVTVYRIGAGMTERLERVKTRDDGGSFSASFPGSAAEATYVVADAAAIKSPAAVQAAPAAVDITSGSANTLVVTHPDFLGNNLDRIVATREAQGFDVKVVDVEQIYAQYSNFVVDPLAIKAYLKHAIENMGVEMVLLVGGDTYDYHNYVSDSVSFIPSLYGATGDLIKYAPLDPLYVDVDGDRSPDAAMGRLPVRTAAELANVAQKTEEYLAKDSYDSTAVFAADERYTDDSVRLAGLMNGWSVASANIGEIGKNSAKSALIEQINNGVALTSYFGHSQAGQWAHEGLFTVSDATALSNTGKPTVVTQYGCWNTYYVLPSANGLGHKLLVGENGAAAVTGATTVTSAHREAELGELMIPALATGTTIGEAMQDAKDTLAVKGDEYADVLLGWTVLGVPWLGVE